MNKIWYASYGSNLLEERFMCYIKGGTYQGNGKAYRGCTDHTPPSDSKRINIPFERYYAEHSSSWEEMGVAFIDAEKTGETIGRMYLITDEQYKDVQEQEGSRWYGHEVQLGRYDNIPVVTFTSFVRRHETQPSEAYLKTISDGESETKGLEYVVLEK